MRKTRIILITAIILLSAFLAISCEESINLVGTPKKPKFEINGYLFYNNSKVLSANKTRYPEVAFSGETGTYSYSYFNERFRSYIGYECIGTNLQYKTIDEVTVGDEKFKIGDYVRIAVGNGLFCETRGVYDYYDDIYLPEIVSTVELLNNPYLTINGDKYHMEDLPAAKETKITKVSSPEDKDEIKVIGDNIYTISPSTQSLSFSFQDKGDYCLTKKIYKINGKTQSITHGYFLLDENGNLPFYLDEYKPGEDYNEIEYWVFMAGDENAPVYKAKATISFH